MQKIYTITIAVFVTIQILASCGLDCVDNKTGLHKSSQTLNDSKNNNVFSFTMLPNKTLFHLDSGLIFKIKNAWVENDWSYECVNNKAVVQKDSTFQFVIEAEYKGNAFDSNYWLMLMDNSSGNHLGAVLDFKYSGIDTFKLKLILNKSIIDTLLFVKQVNH